MNATVPSQQQQKQQERLRNRFRVEEVVVPATGPVKIEEMAVLRAQMQEVIDAVKVGAGVTDGALWRILNGVDKGFCIVVALHRGCRALILGDFTEGTGSLAVSLVKPGSGCKAWEIVWESPTLCRDHPGALALTAVVLDRLATKVRLGEV